MLTSPQVKARALELGFDLCGVAPAAGFPELAFLREWLDRGYAGEMAYLERTARARADVRALMPSARSVLVAAVVYHVDRPCSTEIADPREALISRYAWGDDYHDVLGRQLADLLAWMRGQARTGFEARAYVDTGPVQERVYAQYAGLGWIGKNGCLINPALGSWLFLSEIVCSLELDPDVPGTDRCGACTLCLEACPTGAIVEPRTIDATRCLSYLTIEQRGAIPEALRERVGAHVYGCDICQDVCPWNQAAARSTRPEWQPRPAFDRPRTLDLWRRSDTELGAALRRSPMKRARLAGLRRNLAVALGNSRDAVALAALEREPPPPAAEDGTPGTAAGPLVAEHLAWAMRTLRDGTHDGQPGGTDRPTRAVRGTVEVSWRSGRDSHRQREGIDMLISKELNKAINDEIGREFYASHQYLTIAAYFDGLALRKLAKMFYKQSDEERAHGLKFAKYVVEAGGTLDVPAVEAPKSTFKSVEEAVRLSLDWELEVTKRCNELMALAIEQKDYIAQDFLRWFVTEQLEEVSTMENLLKVTQQAGERNIIMLEAYLSHE